MLSDVPVAEVWLLFQNLIASQLLFKYSTQRESLAIIPTICHLAFGVPAWTLFSS